MENKHACVWATRKALWDSFLNDPELTQAIDQLRTQGRQKRESIDAAATNPDVLQKLARAAGEDQTDEKNGQDIVARLRAYETPITDEILRQSIR